MKVKSLMTLTLIFFTCAGVLTSCSPDGTGYECGEGICIRITCEGPVQALEPAEFIISVKTDKDISDLGISLYSGSNVTIQDLEIKTYDAELLYQGNDLLTYSINTKGGEEYTLTGHMVLGSPSVSYGVFSYDLFAAASLRSGFRITDSISVYLEAEGKQVEDSQAILELETDLPLPTQPPDMIVITRTPWPTIIWPTETSLPTATPTATATSTTSQTLPPYP